MLLLQKDCFSDSTSSGAPSLVHEMKRYKLKVLVLNLSVEMPSDPETSRAVMNIHVYGKLETEEAS